MSNSISGPAGGPVAHRRYVYLDVLRCISIYLVILAHCFNDILGRADLFGTPLWWATDLLHIVTRVSIPLFFMISGYLHLADPRTDNVVSFYLHRLGRLLLPFLVWDIFYFIFYKCFNWGNWTFNLQTFVQELVGQGSSYHLWFIYQIGALYLLMPFLKRIVDHSSVKEQLIFLGVVLLQPTIFRLLNVVQNWVTFSPFLAIVEGYTGYVLVGYLLGSQELSPRARRWIYILGLVGLVSGTYGNYAYSEPTNVVLYCNEGYFITNYMTSAACFVLAKQVAEKMPGWLKKVTVKLSGLTFGIYFSHVMVLEMMSAVLARTGIILPPPQKNIVLFFSTSVFTTLFVWVVSHMRGLKKLLM